MARSAVRRARDLIGSGNQEEAEAAIREAASVLDRAARQGVIHPNNAARRKSRLMRLASTTAKADTDEKRPRRRRARDAGETSSTRTKKK